MADEDGTTGKTTQRDGASATSLGDAAQPQPGDRVGNYVIREQLGEGGFAVVYAAEQEKPVRRKVALKIIKLGMDTRQVIARFEAERQALAMMDHPNVAKVFDAGATDTGRPYFVMEDVAGTPITEYCDHHRIDIGQRLRLFIQVCDAIQHAHQKAIIHRDIKPLNVLVSVREGQPLVKVIDFGIAKAISHRLTEKTIYTEHGQLIGTPEYMSPEQAEMGALDVDTRTDIYSLGVLLYELLVGVLPFDPEVLRRSGLAGIQRTIREVEPHRPSTRLSSLGDRSDDLARQRRADPQALRRRLRGDLDWITMQALEKDRTRRYATASALQEDIVRHLNDEPITAGRPSPVYRLKKFLKRNRANAVVAAALLLAVVGAFNISLAAVVAVMIVVVVGLAITIWMYRIAEAARRKAVLARDEAETARRAEAEQRVLSEEARREAERQTQTARSINEFLEQMLAARVPWSEWTGGVVARDVKIVDVLDAASKRIGDALPEDSEVEAAVRATLGRTYMDLGYTGRAGPHLTRALELRRRLLGDEHPDTLTSTRLVGWLYNEQRSLDDGEPLFARAFETSLRVLGEEHPETVESMSALAIQYQKQGRYDEARALFEKALELHRRILGEEHPRTILSMINLADAYQAEGRLEEAEALGVKTLEVSERVLGREHTTTSYAMSSLSGLYAAKARWDEAEALAVEALETHRQQLGEEHPDTLLLMSNLGMLYIKSGLIDKARPLVSTAVDRAKAILPHSHRLIGICLTHHGSCLTALERYRDAESALREGFRILEAALNPKNMRTKRAIDALVDLYSSWGKPEQAAEWRAKLPAEQEAVASDGAGVPSSDKQDD